MIRYMLDTNACIGVINDRPAALRARLLQVDPAEVAISQIVHYELAFGVCHSGQPERNRANLAHFLKYVQVLDWGEKQAAEAAAICCARGSPSDPTICSSPAMRARWMRPWSLTTPASSAASMACRWRTGRWQVVEVWMRFRPLEDRPRMTFDRYGRRCMGCGNR